MKEPEFHKQPLPTLDTHDPLPGVTMSEAAGHWPPPLSEDSWGKGLSRVQEDGLGASQGLSVRWLRESCEKIPSPGL